MNLQKVIGKKKTLVCILKATDGKEQDPDPEPNPLVRGTDLKVQDQYQNVTNPEHCKKQIRSKRTLHVLQVFDLMVHILARAYTASNPWLTDCDRRLANSWLLKIFRLHPGKKVEKKSIVSS
jgi:hypothetical protein